MIIWYLIPLICSMITGTCQQFHAHVEPLIFTSPEACVQFGEAAAKQGMPYRCEEGREL
jgi:hypothetical protein